MLPLDKFDSELDKYIQPTVFVCIRAGNIESKLSYPTVIWIYLTREINKMLFQSKKFVIIYFIRKFLWISSFYSTLLQGKTHADISMKIPKNGIKSEYFP